MIYLICSILAASLIFIIFKLFSKYNIDTLQAIVVNYITASVSGIIAYSKPFDIISISQEGWFLKTLFLGILFILVFNIMAITTQKNGLSVAAVATKMSLIIPIVFGIFAYQENIDFIKTIGILLALIAVYLTSTKTSNQTSLTKSNLIFPILVFIGSGIVDTSIKFLETTYVSKDDVPIFSASIFGFAALTGALYLLYKIALGSVKIELKNIFAGIGLGVPNYFSIYFLIQALRHEGIDSSTIFTINNVAVLLVCTLAGILFFKERLLLKNWIGISLAIVSIILVALSV